MTEALYPPLSTDTAPLLGEQPAEKEYIFSLLLRHKTTTFPLAQEWLKVSTNGDGIEVYRLLNRQILQKFLPRFLPEGLKGFQIKIIYNAVDADIMYIIAERDTGYPELDVYHGLFVLYVKWERPVVKRRGCIW